MMEDLRILLQLLEPRGKRALAAASLLVHSEADFLSALQSLRRDYPDDLARHAAAQAVLRIKASAKFTQADRMFFTREGLEQASGELVSGYRAARLGSCEMLADLTAGIGGDAVSFARHMPVLAVERDPRTMAVLQANRISLGLEKSIRPVLADSTVPGWKLPGGAVLFLDPARRTSSGRVYSIHRYTPDFLPFLKQLDRTAGIVVKVSPAVKMDEIEQLGAEVEFISTGGELKEAALWFGPPAQTRRRATVLPEGCSLTDGFPCEDAVTGLKEYLYEPDPAVLRAGLVQHLACQLGASRIEPSISLLTSNGNMQSVFARCYRVVEVIPFGLKRIRAALRERGVGSVTLKKRGSAVDTPSFEKQLRLRGDNHATVLLTRTQHGKVALVIEPVDHDLR